ncbi:TlpA family protein disulfide reductase [Microbacterium sp.]|uniref:TlpA family protein disulfide reductase n=1 Tax=Microbacterium sp. TaxID=51671 RepID=UPI0039E5F01D
MSPPVALALAGALIVLAIIVGVVLRLVDGRRRGAGHLRFDPAHAHGDLGSRATLVQFSTEQCARCPQVRRLLGTIAASGDGLAHVEVDLTHRPELSQQYHVLSTPTTFLVDRTGAVRARFTGVPHRQAIDEALAAL